MSFKFQIAHNDQFKFCEINTLIDKNKGLKGNLTIIENKNLDQRDKKMKLFDSINEALMHALKKEEHEYSEIKISKLSSEDKIIHNYILTHSIACKAERGSKRKKRQ